MAAELRSEPFTWTNEFADWVSLNYATKSVREAVNVLFLEYEAWQVACYTIATVISIHIILKLYPRFDTRRNYNEIRKCFYYSLRRLPYIGKKIQDEVDKACKELQSSLFNAGTDLAYLQKDEIFTLIQNYELLGHVNWKKGNVSGTVYNYDRELTKLIAKVYERFVWSNPLHTDVFPEVVKMEAEVIRMCLSMFHGDSLSCGSVTSGGTESILMACLSYRNKGYKLGISQPEIVAPITAHAAFNKACDYFGMKLISVPVDRNFKVDLIAMRRAITKNTVMLVASAPQYPHGIIDDVESIAQIALRRRIGLHVDCCLGGFILPFLNDAGYDEVRFDFTVPGVTSISADTHKYGFAPKGSSVVLYRDLEQRHLQYFSVSDWPGGIYASPSIAGSRSGAVIAGCWAAMVFMGWPGYVRTTKKILKVAHKIRDQIKKIDGLYILGDPKLSVIAIGSRNFDIYQLNQLMSEKGWNLNALQFPSSIHICCTMTHAQPGVATKFLKDIKEAAALLMKEPQTTPTGSAAMYGMAQTIPDRSIITDLTNAFLDGIYKT